MFTLTRIRCLKFATAGILVTLALAVTPTRADELAQNLGPVGPHEPILTTVGSKRVIAFYVPNGGHCAVNAVVWNTTDVEAGSAARVRVSLNPRQTLHLDSVENESLNLQCGDYAKILAVVDDNDRIALGTTK